MNYECITKTIVIIYAIVLCYRLLQKMNEVAMLQNIYIF